MKKALFIILEDNDIASSLMHELAKHEFNGIVIPTTSLKHILHSENSDTPLFITLNMLYKNNAFEENTTIISIVDEEKLDSIQKVVREITANFTLVKGAVFSIDIKNYEGSF